MVPATWETEVGGSSEPGEVEAAVSHNWATACTQAWDIKLDFVSKKQTNKQTNKKTQKPSQARGRAPVVPATQEAEAGEWREPGSWSLQ